ncbi:uncharacterized protein [Ptychodera flava]|uniref:uncharacterized protein n=1 Tax=Ptychodera flava TaxID=63121 RepID=UPI003969F307
MASSDVRPGTSDTKGGVPAGRPDSNGGRPGSTTATKTKSNMVKKALIVSDRWGPSIHGGITDALHVVIRLLQDMGISVHCTAVKATKKEEADAKKLGVTLELPTQTGVFEFREPHSDWLLYHNEHFPHLEELTNVKFVFGFSAFTSIPTFKILSKVFPKASCYLINLFDKDDITPLIVGCSKEELEFRKRIMSDEFKNAKCSFSVGESVHAEYKRRYQETNQQLLSPMINKEYLAASGSDILPVLKGEKFKIISVVQKYEFEDPEKLDVAIKAVNDAAEIIYQFNKTPSVWKIIGIPPSKGKEIAKKLTRSSRLKITPKIVTSTEELNSELMSSHLVLIPPSTTSYGNLTLAAMCAAIPVVYPEGSHSDEIVSKHIDNLEATECAIDMDEGSENLKARIVSVITKYPTAFERAKIIRDHIKEKVAQDLRGSNGSFVASITADMQSTSPHKSGPETETEYTVEHKGNGAKVSDDDNKSKVSDRKDETGTKEDEVNAVVTELPTEELTTGRADDKENLSGASVDQESKAEQPGSDEDMAESTSDKNLSSGRKRRKRQIEIKVEPDGIIPKRGKSVAEVDAAFFSNKQTKENAVLVGKQLDQRHKHMKLHDMGEGSISYIMDCQSLEALESLMDDYSSGSLYRMVKSTFLSESLLDEIGALYLSLGTSIDYEEYLLCQEELEGNDIYHLPIEVIEEMNEEIKSDILREHLDVTMRQHTTRRKATDRDILQAMSVEQERGRQTELNELMNEWIKIQTELQQLNASHSELVFDRQEFVRNTGAIINEVDIPVGIKQELMMAFQKSLPFGPDKSRKPDQKLVIEGDMLMEYVENIVHDFDIPTKGKQDIIEQFRKLVRAKSGKATAKASLTAKQEDLQERIQAIVDDADIPDEQKEVYHQLRQVERGTPLSNTVRVLLSRDGKKSSGEVFDPEGLTKNQNGHVVVCDYGHGSVKTVTADTAQILTSVTVHGLPHNFKPYDTKMADNGDYYTADVGNKCIVVSDAKSEVKQIIAMGKLMSPTGVFVDKDRNVFVADYSPNCVIKCNRDGDIISSQQLSGPWSLTMNSKYQLIVSCRGDVKCIYVLDSNLEILNQFGSDHLEEPYGVTVDNADNIYVADYRKIVKFDRQGEYQETVTVDGDPYYIAVFTDGRIVYSDDLDNDYTVKVIYK